MHECRNHNTCIDTALTKAKFICEDKGLRLTKIREFILKTVWENHMPTKAYELLDKIRSLDYSPEPPTVYRALDFLLNVFIELIKHLKIHIWETKKKVGAFRTKFH